jgi:transposase
VLGFLRTIRMRYPAKQRIYLVMDNLSTHWTKAIRDWAAQSNVELVATPTYASFLNRIECHFWAIGEFVVKNADHRDWDTLAKKGFHNDLRRRQQRIEQARTSRAVWISG